MKNTLFHLCKGVFLAFFILASIACDTPSVTDTPKSTEKTPDEQATPKVADIGATAEGEDPVITKDQFANQGIAEVNFKQDSDIIDIRGGAFKDNKISQLELPDTVERVGKDAFKGNPLQKLTLGEKLDLTKVQKDAFATSEGTLTVVLKKPQLGRIDAEALARVFGKKTVQFEADPTISGPEKATLDTHVATLNEEGKKIPALRTVSFYDGEALITQTHGTTGNPVAWPEPALLPSRTGQRIENWYEAPDLSGSAFDFDTAITKDMSLYAKWGSAPTIERIAFTSPTKIYKATDVIEVTVTFTEAVAVVTTDGTPKVVLKIGIEDKEAEYQSDKGTPTTLVFEYTVEDGDEDANGIEIVANKLDANRGTIKKASIAIDIPAVLVHERVHAPTMTVDTTEPEVKTIAFTSPEKTYKATDVIQITVTFSEVVDVDIASGTPQVVLKIGTADKNALYKSGDGTRTLVFEYTVQAGDIDTNGIEIEADKLDLNGGTITDTAGNNATLMYEAVADDPQRNVNPTAYTFGFAPKEEHKQAYTNNGTYPYPVTETNKPTGDTRDIRYTPSSTKIATVDNTGTVTFVTAGTVIITATKPTADELEEVSDSYTLYITKKPADQTALITEIRKAINAHGNEVDLNYIDTSLIQDMSLLFSSTNNLGSFNGKISKWDVSAVTAMIGMFSFNTVFNDDLSEWKIGKVTNMTNMFYGATAFKRNLNAWGSRFNGAIKNDWTRTTLMFRNSGLKDSLPTWCENSHCKNYQ